MNERQASTDAVIFGTQPLARLLWYVLTHDSRYRVVGFTAHRAYCTPSRFMDLPVIPFEDLPQFFPPERCELFVALGWTRMNALRAEVLAEGRRAGYRSGSWISSRAVVWPDLCMGDHCLIFEGAIVQPFARIGDNCVLRAGANLSHDVSVGNHCFIAGNAMLGGGVQIGDGSFVGLGATVRDRLHIAPGCFIAAGATVVDALSESGVYAGVPARRIRDSVDEVTGVGRWSGVQRDA